MHCIDRIGKVSCLNPTRHDVFCVPGDMRGGYFSPPYFFESWRADRELFALISLNNSWNEFTCQISWSQHHFYSFYGLLKNFRFHSKLGFILVAVLGIPQEIGYNFRTSGPMLLKLGQNTSIGCKLKVLKAEPTKWSWKKVIRIKKIGGLKLPPHVW